MTTAYKHCLSVCDIGRSRKYVIKPYRYSIWHTKCIRMQLKSSLISCTKCNYSLYHHTKLNIYHMRKFNWINSVLVWSSFQSEQSMRSMPKYILLDSSVGQSHTVNKDLWFGFSVQFGSNSIHVHPYYLIINTVFCHLTPDNNFPAWLYS